MSLSDGLSNQPPSEFDRAEALQYFDPELKQFSAAEDQRTLRHSIRVSRIGRLAARQLRLDKTEVDIVEISGLMHDYGKLHDEVSVIVNSDRTVSAAEREVVNLHSRLGFEAIYDKPDDRQRSMDDSCIPLRSKGGYLFTQVALNTLFSHFNAHDTSHRAPDVGYLTELVQQGIIDQADADTHSKTLSCQLLCCADVMDALLDPERHYVREPIKTAEDLAAIVQETVSIPDVPVQVVAERVLKNYHVLVKFAQTKSVRLLDNPKPRRYV